MEKKSFWNSSAKDRQKFSSLSGTIGTDTVIIGAGITGLTVGYLLSQNSKVVVLEAARIGDSTTGFSSCHLTTDIDEEYRNIFSSFDESKAKAVAASRTEAINFIENTIRLNQIECNFQRVPGYLYADIPEQTKDIEEEAEFSKRAGLATSLTDDVPLPFKTYKGLLFPDQAIFNSTKYLDGLATKIIANSGSIYEKSSVVHLDEKDDYILVKTEGGSVKAKNVIMATHLPLFFNVLQTVSAPYISYLMAVKLRDGNYPQAIFWDMDDPYHYIRTIEEDGQKLLLVGGKDHKTGHVIDTEDQYDQLEKYIQERFNVERIEYRWSAQYYEPADGLPYIGRSPFSKKIFVATGYSGDGLVYGTIAGIILSSLAHGMHHPWEVIYDSTRFTPGASAFDFIKENTDVLKHFIKDRITSDDNITELLPGEGKIAKIDGEKYAIAKDEKGEVHCMSPVCPHMKCFVQWNNAEKTWDCPCHGSRFQMDGKVVYGPAVSDLTKKEIPVKAVKK